MENDSKLSNFVQCPHHNTGYCKFCDQCRYQHFFTICSQNVCRDKNCQKGHSKTCRNGNSCSFHVLNACAYKHSIETFKTKENEDNSVVESLQKEIESLRDEISQLKNIVMLKEEQFKDKLKDISKMEQKISVLENENKNLKKTAVESKVVVKSNTNNQNKSNTKFNLSSKNSENSDNEAGKKAGCDKCDFSSTDQFSLLLHKSTKHPTYILNSQPEAVTGPLH